MIRHEAVSTNAHRHVLKDLHECALEGREIVIVPEQFDPTRGAIENVINNAPRRISSNSRQITVRSVLDEKGNVLDLSRFCLAFLPVPLFAPFFSPAAVTHFIDHVLRDPVISSQISER